MQIGGCCRCLHFDVSLQIAWQRQIILVSNQSSGCVKKLRKGTVCVAAQDGSSKKTGGSPVRHVPAMHTKPAIQHTEKTPLAELLQNRNMCLQIWVGAWGCFSR